MGQEFVIKAKDLEDKINQLLPSQGGSQAGVDLSASTMIVPIVDLTETASGSTLRQDLQTSLSHSSVTAFSVNSATTATLVNNVGYFRVFGSCSIRSSTSALVQGSFALTDGITPKIVWASRFVAGGASADALMGLNFDFIVKISAGESLTATSTGTICTLKGSTRQIATGSGELVNP